MRSQLDGKGIDSANSGLDALELVLRRIADREEMSRNLTDSDETPEKLEYAKQSLTSIGKTNSNSRGESVTLPSASSSQNLRFQKSVFVGQETTPVTSQWFGKTSVQKAREGSSPQFPPRKYEGVQNTEGV